MKDKCDVIWTEQEHIRKFSPTYYMSVYWLKKVLKDLSGDVLEIGCGDCSKVKHFINNNVHYVGIDHSDIAVKKARRKGYEVYKKSAANFSFDKKFDYILSLDMLEHVKDDEKVIQQCRNNLKDDGKLILVTCIHQELFGPLDVEAGHFRRYDPDLLLGMIRKNGFGIIKVYYKGFPLCQLYRRIQHFLGKNKGKSKEDIRYIPKGTKLKIAINILSFILPLFKIDALFSSKCFKNSRGIIIIAKPQSKEGEE